MDRVTTLYRSVREGFHGFLHSMDYARLFALLVGLFIIIQTLLFGLLASEGVLLLLEEQTDLRLEIIETATTVQIQDLYQQLRQLPAVKSVTYITREQAYERIKQRDPTLISFVQTFGIQNPFPETMVVRLRSLSQYPAFIAFLRQPIFAAVIHPSFLSTTTNQEASVYSMLTLTSSIHTLGVLVVTTLLIIIMSIMCSLIAEHIRSRQSYLTTLTLLGAPSSMTVGPLFIQLFLVLLVPLVASIVFVTGAAVLLGIIIPSLRGTGILSRATTSFFTITHNHLWTIIGLEILCPLLIAIVMTLIVSRSIRR